MSGERIYLFDLNGFIVPTATAPDSGRGGQM